MPGFMGVITSDNKHKNIQVIKQGEREIRSIRTKRLTLEQNTVSKFLKDKVFEQNEDIFIAIEGVIINSSNLIEKYKKDNMFDVFSEMYHMKNKDFITELRGSFTGILYDKKTDEIYFFTDHIGSKQLFWMRDSEAIVISSDLNYLIEYCKEKSIPYSLNEQAAYQLLTFGFLLEDNTMFDRIHKVGPGTCMIVKEKKINSFQYYRLSNIPDESQTVEEMIENIDLLFRRAVELAFKKDVEYGYKHLVGLSGGLDSRMTTWIANDLGFGENILNFTFSESNYLDETIPKEIASFLKHEWFFKSLDNGLFLKNIDETTRISVGGALYYGLAHSKSCFDLIKSEPYGIVHTGQLGDVILGTFYSSTDPNRPYSLTDGVYSLFLQDKVKNSDIKNVYENEEIFKFYTRGFTGANQGLLVAQEQYETYSPFYDVEFMEYCLKIPVKYRINHGIYKKWIIEKYPLASEFIWEKINGKITEKTVTIFQREVLIRQLPQTIVKFLSRKMGISKNTMTSRNHMNPLDYWYENNKDLKKFMDQYFDDNILLLKNHPELFKDSTAMYTEGNNIEKNQVLTLLSVMKQYIV